MSNDYSSDPPVATAGQLLAISDKINDISKNMDKLAEMPQKLDRMNMQLEQLNKEHQQTRNDLTQTRDNLQDDLDRAKSNFKSEIKQVRNEIDSKFKEMDMQIRVLHESKTKAETATTQAGSAASLASQASAIANQAADTADTANQTAATALSTANVAATQSGANATRLDAITLELGDKASTGALSQTDAKVAEHEGKISANTTKIDGVYAQVNPKLIGSTEDLIGSTEGFAGTWTLQSAVIENDMALSQRIDTTVAQIGDNTALIQAEVIARADANSALGQRIDTVQSATATAQTTANDALGRANTATQNIATVQNQVNTLTTQQGATATQVGTIQTTVGQNTASIQEVSESVNGLYAQKYIKLDVNGKVAGWGGANDGKESNFTLNFDSFAIGSGDSTGYYPFIFRNTPFTDPVTGTVFPVSAYLKSAMIDYQSVKTSHIEDLAVKTAKIDDLAVTTAKIGDLQVDTLKIKDNAVTVPIGATWGEISRVPNFNNQLLDEASIQAWFGWSSNAEFASIALNRTGGKVAVSGSLTLDEFTVFAYLNGQTYASIGSVVSLIVGVFRNGTEVARHFLPPVSASGYVVKFAGSYTLPTFIDDTSSTGPTTYTLKVAIGRNRPSITGIKASYTYSGIDVAVPMIFSSRSMLVLELKK